MVADVLSRYAKHLLDVSELCYGPGIFPVGRRRTNLGDKLNPHWCGVVPPRLTDV